MRYLLPVAYRPKGNTMTHEYITRIPANHDYTKGDISNMYVFPTGWARKSDKRMTEHGRIMVKTLADSGYWPGFTWEDLKDLPDETLREFAAKFTHLYHNVERMDLTKHGLETVFQHDYGSFGTDTRKVFTP